MLHKQTRNTSYIRNHEDVLHKEPQQHVHIVFHAYR